MPCLPQLTSVTPTISWVTLEKPWPWWVSAQQGVSWSGERPLATRDYFKALAVLSLYSSHLRHSRSWVFALEVLLMFSVPASVLGPLYFPPIPSPSFVTRLHLKRKSKIEKKEEDETNRGQIWAQRGSECKECPHSSEGHIPTPAFAS